MKEFKTQYLYGNILNEKSKQNVCLKKVKF